MERGIGLVVVAALFSACDRNEVQFAGVTLRLQHLEDVQKFDSGSRCEIVIASKVGTGDSSDFSSRIAEGADEVRRLDSSVQYQLELQGFESVCGLKSVATQGSQIGVEPIAVRVYRQSRRLLKIVMRYFDGAIREPYIYVWVSTSVVENGTADVRYCQELLDGPSAETP